MRAIFLSYRRDDAEGEAGRLFDDLIAEFSTDKVFMDVTGIEPGRDFRKVIDQNVASCGVLLAIMGKDWIDAEDDAGRRRLDDPLDFVRLETASALRRDIPVIPVLVHGGHMPRPEQLPEDLKDLAYRNAVELTHARWDSDVQLLIKALRPHVEREPANAVGASVPPLPDRPLPETTTPVSKPLAVGTTTSADRIHTTKSFWHRLVVPGAVAFVIALIALGFYVYRNVEEAKVQKAAANAAAKQAAEEKAAAEQAAARRAAEEKAAAEKVAAEQAAAKKAAAEQAAARKAAEERAAAEKVAAEQAVAKKAAAQPERPLSRATSAGPTGPGTQFCRVAVNSTPSGVDVALFVRGSPPGYTPTTVLETELAEAAARHNAGRRVGSTPTTVELARGNTYDLMLSKTGYRPYQQRIDCGTGEINVQLEKGTQPCPLAVTSTPSGANVFLSPSDITAQVRDGNGRMHSVSRMAYVALGQTPTTVELPSYTSFLLRLEKEGYLRYEVGFKSCGMTRHDAHLRPSP